MTEIETPPSSRPLELPTPFWIGLAVVMLLGMVQHWRDSSLAQRLSFGPRLLIDRHSATTHEFAQLGVKVSLPDGWVYLAIADDAASTSATLMHAASNSIVSLRQNRLDTWPPQGHTAQQEVFASVEVDWVYLKLRRMIRVDEEPDDAEPTSQRQIAWTDLDPRFLGRLVPRANPDGESESDLIMILVTHQSGERVNAAVRSLCDSIEFLGDAEQNQVAGIESR